MSDVWYFLGVSCLTGTTDCVAIGNEKTGQWPYAASTTTDGGSTWTSSVLDLGDYTLKYNGVSCTGSATAATCVAIWNTYYVSSTSTAEAFVGTGAIGSLTWSSGSAFPTAGDVLTSVACPSTSSCVAVGENSASSPTAGVADTLSIASGAGTWGTTPVTPSGTAALEGVACTSSSDCVAVGYWTVTSGTTTYDYDATTATTDGGSAWSSAVQFSDSGTAYYADYDGLTAVACASSTTTECSAVGSFGSSTSTNTGQSWVGYQPLACVYGSVNSNGTCTFSSTDTLSSLGGAGTLTLQPSSIADPGVLVKVSTELASTASTSDETATATVPLNFTVSS